MSYARWGEDGSTVYVFGTGDRLVCMQCKLLVAGADAVTNSAAAMLAHLMFHRQAGHIVPERAILRLQSEAAAESSKP